MTHWPETFHAKTQRLRAMWDSGYHAGMLARVTRERVEYPSSYTKHERTAFVAGLQYALRGVPRERQPWMRLYPVAWHPLLTMPVPRGIVRAYPQRSE